MFLTKDDFKKGQEVACKHIGNLARHSKGHTVGKVKSVGKLVTVELGRKSVRFELGNTERDYLLEKITSGGGDYFLFPSEQAYFEYEEKNKKLSEIKSAVAPYLGESKLTIEQVRRVYEIIIEQKEQS